MDGSFSVPYEVESKCMTSEKMVPFQYITSQANLYRFLDEIEKATWIGYDTEFISEGRYLPELCLVQVATEMGNYLLDPLKIHDLNPFWERLCREDTVSIVHACRSELEFCFRAIKRFPARVFDVQLAAAFVGYGYPLNFKSLACETIQVSLEKSETLTDWKRRPLLSSQLRYAINDVCHLRRIAEFLRKNLDARGRMDWFEQEMIEYAESLKFSFTEERWRKVVGSKLSSGDELTVFRDLWIWRQTKALAKNTPPTRILRDDLLISLAKLHTADPERIAVMRGVSGLPQSQMVRELSEVIKKALNTPEEEKPRTTNHNYPVYKLATQLVGVLLVQYCHRRDISYHVVTTTADIRQAIAEHEGTLPANEKSRLTSGWRAEFLGDFLTNVLNGRYAMQLTDNLDEHPLRLIDVGGAESKVVPDMDATPVDGDVGDEH